MKNIILLQYLSVYIYNEQEVFSLKQMKKLDNGSDGHLNIDSFQPKKNRPIKKQLHTSILYNLRMSF